MNSDSIQVAIRVRPLSPSEVICGYQNIIKKINDEPQILVGGTRNDSSFTFNHVFVETDSQETVYTNSVQQMLKKLFEGYNVTILAYGQTGSGKTYTMDTNYNGMISPCMGIIPRAMLDIFENVDVIKIEHDITIRCSFVELYNERVFDLLSKSTNRNDWVVDVREDTSKGIIMPGLSDIEVNSIDEIIACLVRGSTGRTVGATALNETSSRSHAIFTVTIEVVKKYSQMPRTCSYFRLVDLAGSERSKKTKTTGDRLKEGIKINQGLLALGKCITALGDPNSKNFVPYRESKLTRLLQDSLGGNSVTLLIACISPADYNMDETLNTLNYAYRAKNIKNKPIVNDDPASMELEQWEQKIQGLRLEILNLESGSSEVVENEGLQSMSLLTRELREAQRQNQDLQTSLRNAMTNLLNLEIKEDLVENTYNKIFRMVNRINDVINGLMDADFEARRSTAHHMQGIHTISGEMVMLLVSIVDKVSDTTASNQESLLKYVNDSLGANGDYDEFDFDIFHKKQFEFSNEIQQLNHQISVKEELQKQIQDNLATNSNIRQKIVELENTIKAYEKERADLESQTPNILTNDRLHKIEALQKQLDVLMKQHNQQQKLLELREEDAERIKQLQCEIAELKVIKVRTTREMKNFRKLHKNWTLNTNMEINRIRGMETKKKCEMSKMSISNKQRQLVLKRRIAETIGEIKNIEMKIEKKRTVQCGHRRDILGCTKRDIDEIIGITQTEISLDHINHNRERLISIIELLRREIPLRPIEIASTEQQLSQLNKQVSRHHQTIISSKKDDKIKKLIDTSYSIDDQREIVKYLLGEIVYLNKESADKNAEYNTILKSNEEALNKISRLEMKQDTIKKKFVSDLNLAERRNESNIAQLLGEPDLHRDHVECGHQYDTVMRRKKQLYLNIQCDLEYENDQLVQQLAELRADNISQTGTDRSPLGQLNNGASKTRIRSAQNKCDLINRRRDAKKLNDDKENHKYCVSQKDNRLKRVSIYDVTIPRYPYAEKARLPFYKD